MTRIMHKRPLLCYLIILFPLFHTLHLLSSMIIHPSCDWVPIHRPICWMTLPSLYKHLCRGLIQFQIGHFGAFLAYQLWYTRITRLWKSSGGRLDGKPEAGQYGTVYAFRGTHYIYSCDTIDIFRKFLLSILLPTILPFSLPTLLLLLLPLLIPT